MVAAPTGVSVPVKAAKPKSGMQRFEYTPTEVGKRAPLRHAQYTPPTPTDETVLSRRVGGVNMNSQLAHDDCRRIRSTIWKLAKQTVSVSVSV